jgi:hypothetical protein
MLIATQSKLLVFKSNALTTRTSALPWPTPRDMVYLEYPKGFTNRIANPGEEDLCLAAVKNH